MNKFLNLRLNRFVPAGLIALAAAVLLAPVSASATPFVLKMTQQGGNVVANGSGAFDLTGLTSYCVDCGYASDEQIVPSDSFLNIGAASGGLDVYYVSSTGPSSFGSGLLTFTNVGGGSTIVFPGRGIATFFFVPGGYVSGDPLANTTTWVGASFTSLGVTPGTYVWTWGTGADQTFTLIISNAVSAPEPAEFGMFGLGLLLIGGFVGLRRRAA